MLPSMVRTIAALVGLGLAAAVPADAPVAPAPACLTWRTEARYRPYGYDHFVIVHDGCDRAAACDVSTNAHPDPIHVTVQAGHDREVLTFQLSPSREFTATVHCTLAP